MKSIGTSFNSVSEKGEVIIYATGTKCPRLEVKLEGETVWLTRRREDGVTFL